MTPRGIIGRTLGLVALAAGLAACGTTPPPPDQFYRFDVALPPAATTPLLPGVLEVERLTADAMTEDRALHYSSADQPEQLKRSVYQLWVDPPPVLIQAQMVRALTGAHAADKVVTGDFRVNADYLVRGRLSRFEQSMRGARSTVLVEVELSLVAQPGGKLLLLKDYKVERPMADEQTGSAVAAYRAAVEDVFASFLADLGSVVQPR